MEGVPKYLTDPAALRLAARICALQARVYGGELSLSAPETQKLWAEIEQDPEFERLKAARPEPFFTGPCD